jgi:hypothetical protein
VCGSRERPSRAAGWSTAVADGPIDAGAPIGYKLLPRGTAVYGADGERVGAVERVLDNAREHIFDGIVMRAEDGSLRFVDAPEVARVHERAVTLTLDSAAAADLPPPSYGVGPVGRLVSALRRR